MLCLDTEVRTALINDAVLVGLLGGQKVFRPNQPGATDAKSKFPAVVFEDISNVPDFAADDEEKTSRITYQINVYNKGPLGAIINAVERVMVAHGFYRHSPNPMHGLEVGLNGKEILFTTEREC